MSWGSLSQFSPNLQQPMPTMATLSRMASFFIVVSSADGGALPVIVGRAARLVDLPEGQLDGHLELHFLGRDVGHLEVEPRALDVGHRGDERRLRAAGEVVEGEAADRADLVREPDLVELVAREAREADPLARVLRLTAAPAALTQERHVL